MQVSYNLEAAAIQSGVASMWGIGIPHAFTQDSQERHDTGPCQAR